MLTQTQFLNNLEKDCRLILNTLIRSHLKIKNEFKVCFVFERFYLELAFHLNLEPNNVTEGLYPVGFDYGCCAKKDGDLFTFKIDLGSLFWPATPDLACVKRFVEWLPQFCFCYHAANYLRWDSRYNNWQSNNDALSVAVYCQTCGIKLPLLCDQNAPVALGRFEAIAGAFNE